MKPRQRLFVWISVGCVAALAGTVAAQPTGTWQYDYAGYGAPSAAMESLFGSKVAELDAKAYGYNFVGDKWQGDPSFAPYRNLNVISQVFQANAPVTIGVGVNGSPITLLPGDLTFAYTLDYSAGGGAGATESTLKDFQLYREVADEVFPQFESPPKPPTYNPGPFMAMSNILAGAYNTATDFSGRALASGGSNIYGEELDYASYSGMGMLKTNMVEYSWSQDAQLQPGEKAMVLLFARNVQIMRIGWDQTRGYTAEGGNVIGGGQLDQIPVLVPVVPEPASMLLLAVGGGLLLPRRRRAR